MHTYSALRQIFALVLVSSIMQASLFGQVVGGAVQSAAPAAQATAPASLPGVSTGSGQAQSVPAAEQTGAASAQEQQPGNQPGKQPENQPENQPAQVSPLSEDTPNAFQQFVTASTNAPLPMFGYSLFANAPSTFLPVDSMPAPSDYEIGPGDELQLRVWGQVNFETNLTVDRTGNIFISNVGTVSVAGLRYEQLQGVLQSAVSKVYRNFELSVNLSHLRSIQIFVLGKVRRPGAYTVSSLSTLVNALFASGGPSASGTMRRIQLKRRDKVITEFDVYDLLLNGDKSHDVGLMPGDVIFVPPIGSLIAVSGTVNTPAIYELKSESTIGDVLAMAGGLSTIASEGTATLERIDEHTKRTVAQFSLDTTGRKLLVKDGDLLTIFPVSPKFENAVTLRGHVAAPGRYPWHEGIRVRDVIPNRESLIPKDFWQSQNAAVESWSKTGGANTTNTNLISAIGEINWEYALIQRLNQNDLSVQYFPFDLGKCIDGDDKENLELQPGDTITIMSKWDIRTSIAQQERIIRIEGEVARAGWYRVMPGETLRQLLARTGGLSPHAYLFGSEFTRKSVYDEQAKRLDQFVMEVQRAAQQDAVYEAGTTYNAADQAVLQATKVANQQLLERLHDLKPTGRIVLRIAERAASVDDLPDIVLEDGDRFYVPYRLASVNILGEVNGTGSYLFDSGASTEQYLREAGGTTRHADTGHAFVIRANGAVMARNQSGMFAHGFDSSKLLPGDTLVVPPKPATPGIGKAVRDWAQMFSQFALGVAAIHVLTN